MVLPNAVWCDLTISTAISFEPVLTCFSLCRSRVTGLIDDASHRVEHNQCQGRWAECRGANHRAASRRGHPAWARLWIAVNGHSRVIRAVSQSNKLNKWVGSSQVTTAGFYPDKHATNYERLAALVLQSISFYLCLYRDTNTTVSAEGFTLCYCRPWLDINGTE